MTKLRTPFAVALALAFLAFGNGAMAQQVQSNVAIPVTPTIQNAAYASGNAIGGLTTVKAFRIETQPSGILDSVGVAWLGGETTALTFYIFDTKPGASTCTDKSAFSLATADVAKLAIPPFSLTAAATTGTTVTSAQSTFGPTSSNNKDSPLTANLYICVVVGGSVTPAVGDLTYKVGMAQD
jgi:hypothetical protein